MKLKTLLLSIFSLVVLFSNAQSSKVIWNGTGEASQSVTLVKASTKKDSKISYKFKNVRYGSIVDKGAFTFKTQDEVKQFISDIEGAIAKSSEESGYEWSRGKYTIKSGGNNSPKKGTFKIWIGNKHCPFKKKDAVKLIKALKPVAEELELAKA